MALPDAVARQQGEIAQYGIRFTLAPVIDATDWQSCDVEIQRAPDSAGSPDTGNAEVIQRIGPIQRTGTPYTDYLPNDGVRRHYRWRHVRVGYQAGAWSSWLRTPPVTGTYGAKPVALPIIIPKPDAVQLTGPLYFSADAPPTVRGPTGTSVLTKTLRIPYTLFAPALSTYTWVYGTTYLYDGTTTGSYQLFVAPLLLPPGATLTSIDFRAYLTSTAAGNTADFILYRDGSSLVTGAASATGWTTTTVTTGLPEVIDAAKTYLFHVGMQQPTAGDTRFEYMKVTYTIPNLAITL